MNRYEEGKREGRRNAKYFNSISEITSHYSNSDSSFLKGFIDTFNEYWEEKLMGEF